MLNSKTVHPVASGTLTPARITRSFAAAPEILFDSWVQPQRMRRWMFVGGANGIEKVTSDRRIGGQFSVLERSGGQLIHHYGRYRLIDRPNRLVFTLSVPRHFPGVSCVTVDIAPCDEGALMTFTQTGVDRSITEAGWRAMFEALARVIEKKRPPSLKL